MDSLPKLKMARCGAQELSRKGLVSASEPACLVRCRPENMREIVVEGTFHEVAAFARRLPPISWHEYIISFPERRIPPFRYEAADLVKAVMGQTFNQENQRHGLRYGFKRS